MGGTGEGDIGIYISRNGGNADGYYLTFEESGNNVTFNVGRLISGSPSSESGDTITGVLMPGTGLPNRLRIEHTGVVMNFYVNGEKVRGVTTSDDLTKGYPALLVNDHVDDAVSVSFDNVYAEHD